MVGGACVAAGGCIGYDEIRSMSGRYASYWNAFLYRDICCFYRSKRIGRCLGTIRTNDYKLQSSMGYVNCTVIGWRKKK